MERERPTFAGTLPALPLLGPVNYGPQTTRAKSADDADDA